MITNYKGAQEKSVYCYSRAVSLLFFFSSPQVSSMMGLCVILVDNNPSLASDGNVLNAQIMICALFVITGTNIT